MIGSELGNAMNSEECVIIQICSFLSVSLFSHHARKLIKVEISCLYKIQMLEFFLYKKNNKLN